MEKGPLVIAPGLLALSEPGSSQFWIRLSAQEPNSIIWMFPGSWSGKGATDETEGVLCYHLQYLVISFWKPAPRGIRAVVPLGKLPFSLPLIFVAISVQSCAEVNI